MPIVTNRTTSLVLCCALAFLTGCTTLTSGRSQTAMPTGSTAANLTPASQAYEDLIGLPEARGRIPAAVYSFRDQTGQYRPAPHSSFSTAVTQGAGAMLVTALLDSKWFMPMEREGLQDLLTERRIIRAALEQQGSDTQLASLMPANILLEGGIVAYETNVRTGGAGARYFGIGSAEQYRTDQVTVNLRAVDIRTGQILHSVFTTKTVYSQQLDIGVFRFVRFRRLLEAELGYTRNEPAQLCVQEAIEAAVTHLVVQGIAQNSWALKNPGDIEHPIVQAYLEEQRGRVAYVPDQLLSDTE